MAEEQTAETLTTYSPMHPRKDEGKTYTPDQDGLREAAAQVTEARAPEAEPVKRDYSSLDSGEKVPDDKTVEIKRAAEDLATARKLEDLTKGLQEREAIQHELDEFRRSVDPNYVPPFDPLKAGAEQLQAQEAQQQFEQQQPQATEQPAQADDEIQKALQNPKIRAALEQEVAQTEQARAQYAQATFQAAQLAAASLYSQFPALQGLNAQQLPVAVATIAKTDPIAAQQIEGHISKVRGLFELNQQAQQAQQQLQAARVQQYIQSQDVEFENHLARNESPESVKRVKEAVFDVATKHYGVSKEELSHLWSTQPIMRTAAFQRMIYDATKYHMAQEGLRNANRPPLPPVQRPGVATEHRADNTGIDAAMKSFRDNPSAESAAKLLMLKRARR